MTFLLLLKYRIGRFQGIRKPAILVEPFAFRDLKNGQRPFRLAECLGTRLADSMAQLARIDCIRDQRIEGRPLVSSKVFTVVSVPARCCVRGPVSDRLTLINLLIREQSGPPGDKFRLTRTGG